MRVLTTLPDVPLRDPPHLQRMYPLAAQNHPQRMRRMRLCFALDVLRWAVPENLRTSSFSVLDPGIGFGTTHLAARALGLGKTIGCEWDPQVARCLDSFRGPDFLLWEKDARDIRFPEAVADLLLFSPPFPNTHHEGSAPRQRKLCAEKGLGAGGQSYKRGGIWFMDNFIPTLTEVLLHWKRGLRCFSMVLVHVRDFHLPDEVARVDEWVAQAMGLAGLTVLGRLEAKTSSTFFRAMHQFPRRPVIFTEVDGGRAFQRFGVCGHSRIVSAKQASSESGHCRKCDPIREALDMEKVVVGEVPVWP